MNFQALFQARGEKVYKESCTKGEVNLIKSAARDHQLIILRLSKLPAMESPGECSVRFADAVKKLIQRSKKENFINRIGEKPRSEFSIFFEDFLSLQKNALDKVRISGTSAKYFS